jgi:ankyrin repeat protein
MSVYGLSYCFSSLVGHCHSCCSYQSELYCALAEFTQCAHTIIPLVCCLFHRRDGRSVGGHSLLHTAALNSRPDCIPLPLAAGADVTAVTTAGCSVLQLACVKCDMPTVQLVLDAGGWLPAKRFDCLLMATRAGSSEAVEALCTATATGTAAGSGSAVNSSSSSDTCYARGTVKGGCTLMHAAAAARSLRCAEVLLRHGVDAAAVSDTVPGKDHISGLSALDLFVLDSPCSRILPHCTLPQWTPAEIEQFALLLLSCGATFKHTAMSAEQYLQLAGALSKHTNRQQQLLRKTVHLATLQATACWYECDGGSSSSSSSGNSRSKTVRVQLLHAVTKQRSKRVYVVDTQLLAQLYSYIAADAVSASSSAPSDTVNSSIATTATGQRSSSSSSSSDNADSSSGTIAMQQAAARQNVLVKMIVPPEGWHSATTNELKLISYDGKCACSTVITLLSYDILRSRSLIACRSFLPHVWSSVVSTETL